ncbi:heme/hemin ABC transporter substrate-binding protein [Sphingobacterium pedocola]|uniref:Hemin ABC transporter substrate-binding protein n=1 Tax=Sphingobacterium pedocola TaxID=2082722 RepID=A0ABR9T7G3_9SPHI|nr:ABC transporter substrate-binding protein [Sphingobacterium pedocola]MBE8721293.1 hemin ABC transporter substrate-binding protein [Sphingobacterium pedocola]
MLKNRIIQVRITVVFFLIGWVSAAVATVPQRIITLSSALTETVYAMGYGASIVATDVTSVSPAEAAQLPRVSKNRSVSTEGLMAYRPDLILAPAGDVPAGIMSQLKSAGIRVVEIKQEFSEKGAIRYIDAVAQALHADDKGKELIAKVQRELQAVKDAVAKKADGKKAKVLFIYARGTGTMSVAGKGSSLDAIITLAGARNAVQEFADFKPYTTESLVKANPDVILLFDFGLSSLGGKDAILKMPGVRTTEAGKHKRIIQMNGPLLINFSTRLPEAIIKLNSLIYEK